LIVSARRFGVSTHLFHDHRLSRDHLVHIAAHGFSEVELFATPTHFDYRDPQAIDELAEWLSDTRLALHSVHAPAFEGFAGGQPSRLLSSASGVEARRQAAIAEVEASLALARAIPFDCLVAHVGVPTALADDSDNQPNAARRTVEQLAALAEAHGVRLALEVIPNALSGAATLVQLIEDQLDGLDVGVCLDFGHAHMMGEVADAIEVLSGHLWTTHLHDNRGRSDDHLVPYAGSIDWEAAMMGTQKIGYEGTLLFEVGDTGDPVDVLRRTAAARERLERAFITF
jgi:sugar phosphate isomerase/epimerase